MAQHNENRGRGQQQGAAEQVRQAAGEIGDKAKDFGAAATEKARDVASSAADTARHAVDTAKEQAEQGTAALGSGMRNLASTLREKAPHEGMMGTAASSLADTLERGGHYLEEEGINGLFDDVGTLVRRNPLPAVLIGVGLGFLMAQMCRSER
jgi:hypothetical protein